MDKSIFVVGKNRSGTKWLSNILLNHKDMLKVEITRSNRMIYEAEKKVDVTDQ